MLLGEQHYKAYIDRFNKEDDETVIQSIDNKSTLQWLKDNIPLIDCPDKDIEKTYYFRWWIFRKHIKETPDGYVITEFHPTVPWAGKHNAIVCPAGHHFYEGRWLRHKEYLKDYARFWFTKGGDLRAYSTWLVDALWKSNLVWGDDDLITELLDDCVRNYREWEKSHLHEEGLFWSIDDRDGGEFSISGNGLRPTLNTYMYGDARAIEKMALLVGRNELVQEFKEKADTLKDKINTLLWDEEDKFYKVFPLHEKDMKIESLEFSHVPEKHNVRELHGYLPWYYDIASPRHDVAWSQLVDKEGFYAPFGPTTAEQRHPRFMEEQPHQCLWNGPSWPFITSFVLTGIANRLNQGESQYLDKDMYYDTLKIYTQCHSRKLEDGKKVSWIDENLHPYTGEWLARSILEKRGWPKGKGGKERGKDYNHSSYCDLIINGLLGIRPEEGKSLTINPLIPEEWTYFCLDQLEYKGHSLTVLYDQTGEVYGKGKGLRVYDRGQEIASVQGIDTVQINL